MTETKLHKFLKEVGMAYLFNQNCFLVATEVHITRTQKRLSQLDQHFIIDVCGVGEKYIPYEQRLGPNPYKEKYKYNVVRGIEVKVSRSDFENGFVCSGCNYNYLLVPEGLVYCYELPKEIGLITVNQKEFKASFEPAPTFRFGFEGLRVIKKPQFKKIEQFQIDNAISSIAKRSTRELINRVAENLTSWRIEYNNLKWLMELKT